MAFHNVILFPRDSRFAVMFYINTYVFHNCGTLLYAILVKDDNYMDKFSMNIILDQSNVSYTHCHLCKMVTH